MFWSVTLSLLFGVWLSPYVPLSLEWQLVLLLLLLLLSFVFFRLGRSVWALLLAGIFVTGSTYSRLRMLLSDSGASERRVSETIVHAEEALAGTSLSASHQALLHAMMLGDKKGLSKEQKSLFRNAGAQHLLALSGLHLGILLTLVSVLILRRVRFTRWRWPVLLATLALLWWYALMVGLPRSLLRATIMATLFLIGRFSYRATKGHEVLSSALFIMLLIDPNCASDIGAQLSVMALVGITVFAPSLYELWTIRDAANDYVRPRFPWMFTAWRYFCVSFSAWLFTMPLILYYFGQFQPWQAITGVFLVPVTSVVLYFAVFVLFLALSGVTFVFPLLSDLLDILMGWQDGMLRACGSLPLSVVTLHRVTMWHVGLIYMLFAVLCIALYNKSRKVLFMATLLSALLLSLLALILRS